MRKNILFLSILYTYLFSISCFADKLLIPMDISQTDHIKAYGIAYKAIQNGIDVEWLLNYRGGSFMTEAEPSVEKLCKLKNVSYTILKGSEAAEIYTTIKTNNMDVVLLEKAPRLAVYVAPNAGHWNRNTGWNLDCCRPWDDAVRIALEYAEIPYQKLWDEEILSGALDQYDWLHIHHEDYTGQYGKFYANFHGQPWYEEDVKLNNKIAKKLGFDKVSKLKLAVAKNIKEYVGKGGFLFGMCSAPATLDIALAAEGIDIVSSEFDGDPADPNANSKLDYSKSFAFENFKVDLNPYVYENSDIDVSQDALLRGPDVYFSLFEFSAKYDPIPTMLSQCHVSLIKEFMGQDTGFRKRFVKKTSVVMAEIDGTDEVKYLHGTYGKGIYSYFGGHDPEQFQHRVGDPPTKLELFKNSPGFRLILNNVLFPAAKKKEMKT